jgi:Ca-activated chloride channel family protein
MRGLSHRAILAAALSCAVWCGVLQAQDAQQRRGFSITITEPQNQSLVFGKTFISADVQIGKADLVEQVEFLIGDEVVFVDREPPYEYFHDFEGEVGSQVIRVIATHVEGVTVSDAVITRRLRFSSFEEVNRVILWVSAANKQGNLISDLTTDDFTLYEDDKEQAILDFHMEERPITMAIMIDTSGSMRGEKLDEVHKAAGDFVDSMRPIDKALVIDFDDNVFMIQGLTSDHDALKEAIASTEAIGGTSLFDALHAAYRKIGSMDGRKVIILLSDGEDSTSQIGYKTILEEARSNSMMIYSIALGGSLGSGADPKALKEFSATTGGKFFFVKKASKLAGVYQQIAEELGKQFYLTYSTPNTDWDGHWVKIKVDSQREGVKIRARRGYFAVRKSK